MNRHSYRVRALGVLTGFAVLASAALGFGACGGGSGSESTSAHTPPPSQGATLLGNEQKPLRPTEAPRWVVARLADHPGEDVQLLMGTSDVSVGENRITFALARSNSALVQTPHARVLFARDGERRGRFAEAVLVPVGPHSHPKGTQPHDHKGRTDLYVTKLELPRPGRYWLLVEPLGSSVFDQISRSIQGVGMLDVRRRTLTPPVGSKAIPSDTPTVADMAAAKITTARPPDEELLQYSVKDSLADDAPFVLAFATPKFCVSRLCGPTVEVVDKVRRQLRRSGVRFIHVEIYKNNDVGQGVNQWVREWNLPSEPWVFLVDRHGIIRAKFENSVSTDELQAAVRKYLLP
jgi:hypothetical protein